LHEVEISARIRSLRRKGYSFKEKRAARFVDDSIAKNDAIPDVVHLSSYGQRLADSETEVSADWAV
jgi:hypothetical protein